MNLIKQFGTNYGWFYYPSNLDRLNENSIIYCVGAVEDITHDIEIANKLTCEVYIFDLGWTGEKITIKNQTNM